MSDQPSSISMLGKLSAAVAASCLPSSVNSHAALDAQAPTSVSGAAATRETNSANDANAANKHIDELIELEKFTEAEALARRSLEESEQTHGGDHPITLQAAHKLGTIARYQQQFAKAEPLLKRVVDARGRVLGADHLDTLDAAYDLATVYWNLRRYAEAGALYRAVAAGRERRLGRDAHETLRAVNALAVTLDDHGRAEEAEPLYRRALDGKTKTLGRYSWETLNTMGQLADFLSKQGRYGEEVALRRQRAEDSERAFGADDPDTLGALHDLAQAFKSTAPTAEAEALFKHVLTRQEQALGPEHPDTVKTKKSLGFFYLQTNRESLAEPLVLDAFRMSERTLGPDDPGTIAAANDLAFLYWKQKKFEAAETLYRRLVHSTERTFGPDHTWTAEALNNLAALYQSLGRRAEAEPLLQRAFDTLSRVAPKKPTTPRTGGSLVMLQLRLYPAGPQALETARAMLASFRRERVLDWSIRVADNDRQALASEYSGYFALLADAAWAASRNRGGNVFLEEVFSALQDSTVGAADWAIADQATRRHAIAQAPNVAAAAAERQQWEARRVRLEADLTRLIAIRADPAARRAVQNRLLEAENRLRILDQHLANAHPPPLATLEPLDVSAAQALLGPREALLLAVPSIFATHVIAVTSDGAKWHRSDWSADRLRTAVKRIRADIGIDTSGSNSPDRAGIILEGPVRAPSFDRGLSYQLYRDIIGPAADLLAGKDKLYVVTAGALAALPLSVLVSAPPIGKDDDPAALRSTRWFGDDFALVHVPSIKSLQLLQKAPRIAAGEGGFLGVGNPNFEGTATNRGRGTTQPGSLQIFDRYKRPSEVPLANVRLLRSLARLPGTAQELEQVRRVVGASADTVLQGEQATEAKVRAADLASKSIILFSTHGLTAAEETGTGEPGLVLTPPPVAQADDDGFLSASEIASLQLSAEWVILSACNTMDVEDDGGLGSLSRAFLLAGARNLLASQWPVSDDVAPILITRTIKLERAGVPRAEALRQAMREIRNDVSRDRADTWAHPFYWAPFILIGS